MDQLFSEFSSDLSDPLSSIDSPYFRALARRGIEEMQAYYQDRLAAVYLRGSLVDNEADPVCSDMDAFVFLYDDFTEADRAWRKETNDRLQQEDPRNSWGWLPPARSVCVLAPPDPADESAGYRHRAWLHHLTRLSRRIYGPDLLNGQEAPPLYRAFAQGFIQTPWDVVRHAAGLPSAYPTENTEESIRQFPLPTNHGRRRRKLARLVVLLGAYWLGAEDTWQGYAVRRTIPRLAELLPDWDAFLKETEGYAVAALPATEAEAEVYLKDAVRWADFVGEAMQG